MSSKFKFMQSEVKDETPKVITNTLEQHPNIRVDSLYSTKKFIGDIREDVRKEMNQICENPHLVILKMNSVTFNRLRSTYGYEVSTVPKKPPYTNIIGQIRKTFIQKDETLANFILVPFMKTNYTSGEPNKMKFMNQ